MSVFEILRPAPPIEEIQDPELVKKNYKYWRWRTFYAMWVGYAFFYFSRKSFIFAMPVMQSELGMTKFELGLLGSILYITYGASKFLSGILGDKSNPRYFMSFGLILTGLFNIFFGFSSYFWAFAVFWGLNGWFQGWGWPGCAKLLTHWYSQSERGRWWSGWNTSHNVGGALIPIIGAACAEYFGWRVAMYVPGALCVAAGLFLMNRLRDTPASLGLPPIEKFSGDYASSSLKKLELTTKEILWKYVFCNKFIWLLAIANFLIYVIRTGVNDWSMLYLIEMKNYSNVQAGFCVCWFEIGGFVGSLVAGWSSDLIFKGKRNPINVIYTLVVIGLVVAYKVFEYSAWPLLDSAFIFLFGFFIFGPQMLIGMAAAELTHKKAAATANGFGGFFAYFGAAFAGVVFGTVTKIWGWDSFFLTLFICGALAAAFLIPLWSVKAYQEDVEPARSTS